MRPAGPGEGHDEGTMAAVFHCTPQFDGRGIRIAQGQMCNRDQPTAGGSAEIRDPAVVGAAIGLRQFGVGKLRLPKNAEGGIEHRGIQPLGIEQLQALPHVAGAEGHVRRVGLVRMRLKCLQAG